MWSVTLSFALLRSRPESRWHEGMTLVAVDRKSRNSDTTSESSIHRNSKLVEIVTQRHCSCTISACSELKGTWSPQKTFSWDCMNDLSIFVSNFFCAGFAFWSSSTSLSVLASSNSLFPFLFHIPHYSSCILCGRRSVWAWITTPFPKNMHHHWILDSEDTTTCLFYRLLEVQYQG